MASGPRILGTLLVAAALTGGTFLLLHSGGETKVAPPAPAPAPAGAPASPGPAQPVVATLPTPESAGVKPEDCIEYPDGTRLPPLNGVAKAPPAPFHRQFPFTKIVRKELDRGSGLEWYVHENGMRSTTRLDQGTGKAVFETMLPVDAKPVVDK